MKNLVGASSHLLQNARKKAKTTSMSSTSTPNEPPVEGHPFLCAPQEVIISKKRAMGTLELSFQNEARDIVEAAIVRCVYACGLAFNVVRSPYWQQMVRSINEAPKGFKGPGYEKVRTTLLDNEVLSVEASTKPIKDSWIEIGVTIVSDGWKDARNRPLVNVIAMSTRGAMFLRAMDCEREVKDGPFIANILIQAIEQVGPQNVVQVVETRFASNTIVLRRLVKVKEALSRMVISASWSIWRQSNSAKAAAINALILDDSWWDHAEYLLKFTEPILSMIRYIDMDRPCLVEVYDGIDSMIEDIRTIINQKEEDPEKKFFKELLVIMVER